MKNIVLWNVTPCSLVKVKEGVKKLLLSTFIFYTKMSIPP